MQNNHVCVQEYSACPGTRYDSCRLRHDFSVLRLNVSFDLQYMSFGEDPEESGDVVVNTAGYPGSYAKILVYFIRCV